MNQVVMLAVFHFYKQNFMIHYSSSFREFLYKSDSRIAKILTKINYRWDDYEDKYRHLITTEQIDYITFRSDGTISFLPAGKEHKQNDNGEWAREGRQNGRPGKVIRKLFTEKMAALIPDKEFEIFANQYKAEYNGEDYEFALLENKKIPSVYNMNRVNSGTLGSSCMNGDSSYLGIYKCCPKLKILILKDKEGLLCGRALVWFLEEDFILMDRIYTCKEFMYDMFLEYARKNKWNRKENYKSFDDKKDFVRPDGKLFSKEITVHTDTDFDSYPYIDTFSYGGDGYLCNYPDGPYEYDCTNGSRSGDSDDHYGEVYDDIDDEYICEDDAVCIERGDRRGCTTHRSNTVDVGPYTYWRGASQIIQLEYDDEWYLRDDVVYSERDSADYPESDCVYTGDDWILRDDATEIDGKWYHDDDVVWSKYSRENYVKDECVFSKRLDSWLLEEDAVEKDGDWWHTDEIEEDEEEKYVDKDERVTVANDPNQIPIEF